MNAAQEGNGAVNSRARSNRRSWTQQEEAILIASLKELVAQGQKSDNGFRVGYLNKVMDAITKVFPTTDLKGTPHITSKLSSWKKNYYSLSGILSRSGIGFNARGNFMIDCEDDQWDQIVKVDPNARNMRYKSWPYYKDWAIIFGKDRATGDTAEDIIDADHDLRDHDRDHENTATIDGGKSLGDYEVSLEHLGENYFDSADSISHTRETHKEQPLMKQKKVKVSHEISGIKEVMTEIGKKTDERLAMLAEGIGYEAQLGKARKEAFQHLGNIPELTIDDRFDVCEILGKQQDKLEIFMGLPEPAIPLFVQRLLRNKGT